MTESTKEEKAFIPDLTPQQEAFLECFKGKPTQQYANIKAYLEAHPDFDVNFKVPHPDYERDSGRFITPTAMAVYPDIHPGIVELLVQHGANPNAPLNDSGETLLHVCARNNKIYLAQFLISNGADVDIAMPNEGTPMATAAANDVNVFVDFLTDNGASVNPEGTDITPLQAAIKAGNIASFRFLIAHGADLHTTDTNGWTPFHYAAIEGNPEICIALSAYQLDIDAQTTDEHKETPLHIATKNRCYRMAQYCLSHGANPHIQDAHGFTASHYAPDNWTIFEEYEQQAKKEEQANLQKMAVLAEVMPNEKAESDKSKQPVIMPKPQGRGM